MPRSFLTLPKAEWLSRCIAANTRTKSADLGGSGQDIPFAQAFSNLAHAYLRERAPSLLDNELGFQVVDRSEDNKKALGIIAAKIGSQKLFVPFFFLKNGVKGHELLYLCDRDIFVPLKENWLSDISNRKPESLGSGIDRMEAMRNIANPNLQRMRESPYKFAAHIIPPVRPFLPKLASLIAPDAWQEECDAAMSHFNTRLNLPTFLKTANRHTLGTFINWLQRYPVLADAANRFHGMDKIASAVREGLARRPSVHDLANLVPKYRTAPTTIGSVWDAMAADEARAKRAAARSKISVVYLDKFAAAGDMADDAEVGPEGLDDAERTQLLRDRVLIRDKRAAEEVTIPFKVKEKTTLFNPTESGVYSLLVRPGVFEKCFVALNPYGPAGRVGFATVVRLDGDRNWVNAHAGNLWARSQLDLAEWLDFLKDLPDAKDISTSRKGRYVCVGDRGECTLPFTAERDIGEDDDPVFEVEFSRWCEDKAPGLLGVRERSYPLTEADNYEPWRDGQRIRLSGQKGSRIRSHRGDVVVPPDYKLLAVEAAESDKERDSDELIPAWSDTHSRTRPLQPGSWADAERLFIAKTASLRLRSDGSEVRVNDSRPMPKLAALVHLVRDHGLREDVARTLLGKPTAAKPYECRVKYADPYLTDKGPASPAVPETNYQGYNPMGFSGDTQSPQAWNLPIPELSAWNTDRTRYNPNPLYDPAPMYGGAATQAAGRSQQDTFDTSMISSLLRSMNDDALVDRWLPDLVVGMDRLGRLLFSYYWHGDRFAERYGKRDMPELEDSLRNAFEMVGDVVVFLQQKTVRANPEESLRSLNLGVAAGV